MIQSPNENIAKYLVISMILTVFLYLENDINKMKFYRQQKFFDQYQ